MSEQMPEIRIEPKVEVPINRAPDRNNSWDFLVPIIVALITVLGTGLVTYLNLNSQIKNNSSRLDALKIVGLQTGKENISTYRDANFSLDKPRKDGEGRHFTKAVRFSQDFSTPPVVMLSMSALDVGNESHIRILTYASNVTTRGFDLDVQTWNQSTIYTVIVEWIAVETLNRS